MTMKKKRKQSKITESAVEELSPPDYSTAITRIAVAQICQSVGFRASQPSALKTLTDVAARYLLSLAKSAAASAVSTGRTESNFLDVVCSLEELHSPIGFRGNSNVGQSLFVSSIVADIMKFVNYSREIPFAKALPRREYGQVMPVEGRMGSSCSGSNHIPKWLPAFPVMGGREEVRNGGEKKWGAFLEEETGEKMVESPGKVLKGEGKKKRKLELKLKLGEKVRFKLKTRGRRETVKNRVSLFEEVEKD